MSPSTPPEKRAQTLSPSPLSTLLPSCSSQNPSVKPFIFFLPGGLLFEVCPKSGSSQPLQSYHPTPPSHFGPLLLPTSTLTALHSHFCPAARQTRSHITQILPLFRETPQRLPHSLRYRIQKLHLPTKEHSDFLLPLPPALTHCASATSASSVSGPLHRLVPLPPATWPHSSCSHSLQGCWSNVTSS